MASADEIEVLARRVAWQRAEDELWGFVASGLAAKRFTAADAARWLGLPVDTVRRRARRVSRRR